MSFTGRELRKWIDGELRDVPLPEGLVARLKAIAEGSDARLDEALCQVDVPPRLLAALKSVPEDESLDSEINEIPVPSGLTSRLHQIAAHTDRELDVALTDVAVPDYLGDSVRRVSLNAPLIDPRLQRRITNWAVAAALLISLSIAYLAGMSGIIQSAYQPDQTPTAKPELWTEETIELEEIESSSDAFVALDTPLLDLDQLPHERQYDPDDVIAGLFERPYRSAAREIFELFSPLGGQGIDLQMDVFLSGRKLVATAIPDDLPEVETVKPATVRGVFPPQVKDFDFLTYIRDSVHPFVTPDDDRSLETSQVPLVSSTDSFYVARETVRQGELPPRDQVRVEEFLAMPEYRFPAPEDQSLAIRTAAGPSPFGEDPMSLLHVGVQAKERVDRLRPYTHLTLAIDVSASMGRRQRLDQVRRALIEFVPNLDERDRVSIVAFSEHAEILIENASREDLAALSAATSALFPQTSTNFGEGLSVGASVALSPVVGSLLSRRLIVITDGLGELPGELADQLYGLAAASADEGAPVHVIDVSGDALDDRLVTLARAGDGDLRQTEGTAAVSRALTEILTGAPQTVATDTQLEVRFNPKTVKRYRLLGHEADALGGLVAGATKSNIEAGQTATALFELELNLTGGDDVATVELAWIDPATGAKNRIQQRISRLQFATTLLETAPPLQKAAIAAELAEILRGSPYAPENPAALAGLLDTAERLHPQVRSDSAFREVVELAESAHRLRAGSSAPGSLPPWWRRPLPAPE